MTPCEHYTTRDARSGYCALRRHGDAPLSIGFCERAECRVPVVVGVTIARKVPSPAKRHENKKAALGRALWAEMHARWANADPAMWDPLAERAWLAAWLLRVPKINCTCRAHAARYVTIHPPTLATPADAFVWSVAFHNAVNERRRVPRLLLIEALAKWADSAPGGFV